MSTLNIQNIRTPEINRTKTEKQFPHNAFLWLQFDCGAIFSFVRTNISLKPCPKKNPIYDMVTGDLGTLVVIIEAFMKSNPNVVYYFL